MSIARPASLPCPGSRPREEHRETHVVLVAVVRRLRPPARPHRVLHARRRGTARRPLRAHRRARHGLDRDDRPRQRLRRLRVLRQGQGPRDQPDHRPGGLLHPQHLPLRAQAGALGRRRRRRRLRLGRLHPHDAAGRVHRRHAQPLPALLALLAGGLLLQAARRPRAARGVLPGPDRHHRLPVGRGADLAAPGQLRQGARVGRGVPRHPRARQLLPRADGPRALHRAPGPRRPAAAEQGPRAAPDRHQRQPLRQPRRRHRPRAPAVRLLRQHDGRPEAVQVRRRQLLRQVAAGDARALGRPLRHARGLRQHAADRRALPRRVQRVGQLHAALPLPGGGERGLLVRQGGRARAARALPRGHPRQGPRPGRLRGRGHHLDGVPRLLPGRGRLHQLGQGQQDPRRSGPRVGRRVDVRLRDADHRPRPARARPDLRALPQPRPRLDARLRHRLRRPPPLRGHRLRQQEVRLRPGLDDRHLRHDQGQAGGQGLLADPRLPLLHGRPDHQGDAGRGHGQGRPAQAALRLLPPPLRRGRRLPLALRVRERRQAGRRHRHRHRGPQAAVGRARRGHHHVQRAADRRHPDHAPRAGRRDHHPVRLPDVRVAGPDQDGLPGAAQPHRPRRRPGQHRAQPLRDRRAGGPHPRRPGDLPAAAARRHPRRLPARRRPDARAAAQHATRLLRGHLRRRRALPPRPDGRRLPQQVRPPQDRARAGRADPPRARRAAGRHPRRDLRADRLPGAGDGDRAEARRLLPGTSRPAAPRHGQEEEGRAGQAVRDLLRAA